MLVTDILCILRRFVNNKWAQYQFSLVLANFCLGDGNGVKSPCGIIAKVFFWIRWNWLSLVMFMWCSVALYPGLPGWAGTRKVKPIWILLKQETVSGISWAICKSAPRSRQIATPAPHHSSFLQAGCPSCCLTNSVHWRQRQQNKECSLIPAVVL